MKHKIDKIVIATIIVLAVRKNILQVHDVLYFKRKYQCLYVKWEGKECETILLLSNLIKLPDT